MKGVTHCDYVMIAKVNLLSHNCVAIGSWIRRRFDSYTSGLHQAMVSTGIESVSPWLALAMI